MAGNRARRWRAIERVAAGVLNGGDAAWSELMRVLEPELQVLVRYQKIGRLRGRSDEAHDIILAVFEKLKRDDCRALRGYFDREQRPSFAAWMRRVVQSCAIDYMRGHAEYNRAATDSQQRWNTLATLTTGVGAKLRGTLEDKRAQVIRDLREAVRITGADGAEALASRWNVGAVQARRVAKKGDLYEPVLQRVFAGFSYPEIAAELELSRREVELIVQYLVELLTARYESDE